MADVRLTPCPNCGRRELWVYRDSGGKMMLDRSTGEFVPCFSYWIECPGCRCRTDTWNWYAATEKQAASYWDDECAGLFWFVPDGALRRSLLSSTAAQMRHG